jgi:hypothetical protein
MALAISESAIFTCALAGSGRILNDMSITAMADAAAASPEYLGTDLRLLPLTSNVPLKIVAT